MVVDYRVMESLTHRTSENVNSKVNPMPMSIHLRT
jgi:hypothetical protein